MVHGRSTDVLIGYWLPKCAVMA